MNSIATIRDTPGKFNVVWLRYSSAEARHRLLLWLAAAAAVVLVLALAVYGFGYYRLDAAARAGSPEHALLRPSGSIGRTLGRFGGALFLLIFLYPVRKRLRWLAGKGKTTRWLNFHVLVGLGAPVLITFHSSFKLNGVAGLAYWIMMAVAASGIVGRYFYGQIPRRLDAAEMSWEELNALGRELEDISRLLGLPSRQRVESLPLVRALWLMVRLDLERPFRLRQLGRQLSRETLKAVRRQAALSKQILLLSQAQRIFHLWHVVHRPFSYSFLVLVVLHVGVLVLLGC